MKEQEEGVVIETSGNLAKVRTMRHGDCQNCGACPGDQAVVVDALNEIGAVKGQFVAFEFNEENLVKSSLVLFVLPLAAAAAGAWAGSWIAERLGLSGNLLPILGGALLFGASLAYIRFYDSQARKRRSYPVIRRILY